MAIARMKRLEIIASRSDKFALLNYLQETGAASIETDSELDRRFEELALAPVEGEDAHFRIHQIPSYCDLMHILRTPDDAPHFLHLAVSEDTIRDLIQETTRWKGRIEKALKVLRTYSTEKKPLFSVKRVTSPEEWSMTSQQQEELLYLVESLEEALNARASGEQNLAAAKTHLRTLEPLKELALPEAVSSGRMRSTTGYFRDEEEYHALLTEAEAAELILAGQIYARTEEQIIVLLAWPYSEDDRIKRILAASELQAFPATTDNEREGNFRKAYKKQGKRIEMLEQELEGLESTIAEKAVAIKNLELLSDIYDTDEVRLKALLQLNESRNLFVLNGFVPEDNVEKLLADLSSRFELWAGVTDPDPADESVPTMLKNRESVEPIEAIINTFSPPSYTQDSDPSPIMNITYAFFFGSMLSDIGYGLLLAIGCFVALYKFKAEGGMRQMLKVFASGGLFAIAFGVAYGSLFGDLLPALTDGAVSLPAFWFNPLDEPITLMIWSIVFGAIHLFIAMGIDIHNKLQRGNWYDAAFSVAPWYLIIGGVGLLALGMSFGAYVAIVGAAMILLMSSRDKNPIKRFFSGFMSLYSVTSWLSDLLSYTRILALTLATSVIAMVVNMMAAMIGWRGPQIIFLVVVLLFGHGLNIALSTLSAYVHSTRLHYVEFFGRFYAGGGKLFAPLQYEGKYTRIAYPKHLTANSAKE